MRLPMAKNHWQTAESVIIREEFEICFRMQAGRTYFGRSLAYMHISAFATIPADFLGTGEHQVFTDILLQFQITLFVHFFHFRHVFKRGCNFLESLLLGDLSEGRV